MRVLLTLQPGFGHFHPLVPVAQALQRAGHEVAFVIAPAFSRTIAANGFSAFPAGADDTPEELQQRRQVQADAAQLDPAAAMWTRVFAGSRAERTLPDLLNILKDWRPDVLVRDMTEFAGYVAAEHAGLPHVAVHLAAYRPYLHELIRPPINNLRASVGLAPDPELESLYHYLLLSFFPPGFQDPAVPLPPTTHAIRHLGSDHSHGEQLPSWVHDLPDRPTIYATLGTVMNHLTPVLQAMLDGLSVEPVNLILTVGPGSDPAIFGPQPSHVHIESYIPQSLLLPHCDLIITHGGSGTVKDAIAHGLPLVVVPIAADQHANAARCAALGIAQVITRDNRTPEAIREAAREVLSNPVYRRNAERLRDEMLSLPGPEHAVSLLERLAKERAPLLSPRSE